MINPTSCNFRLVFTRNDNFNNENLTKLEPFKAFFEMSAAENDKKNKNKNKPTTNRDVYNSSSNFIDSRGPIQYKDAIFPV